MGHCAYNIIIIWTPELILGRRLENLACIVMSYTVRKGNTKTGYEILYGKRPNIELIHLFGCHAFSHIPKAIRDKFDPKSRAALYLSPGFDLNGYRLYDPVTRLVFVMSSALFDNYRLGPNHLLNGTPMNDQS